jgi:drug/metabolite transporter (DMT)-like permease
MMLTVILWAFAFPLIKFSLLELSPINLTITRFCIVCSIYLVILILLPNRFTPLRKEDVPRVFLMGFTGLVLYHLGLNYGEQFISASVASLIIATIPVFVVILAAVFLKERITLPIAIGVTISLLGVIIISIMGTEGASLEVQYLSGAAAILLAAVVGAVYTIAGKKMLQRYSPLSLTVYAFLLGSLGLIPFIRLSLFEELSSLSYQGATAVIFLGIGPTVIAYLLWFVALQISNASKLSVYLYFIPVLSTIISFYMFQEQITLLFFLGGTLVILGLYIVNTKRNITSEPSENVQ